MKGTLPLLPRQGAGRQIFLMWIIALMAYLAALGLIGVFMIDNTINAWKATVGGVGTIVIPDPATDALAPQGVVDRLLAVDGVSAVRPVPTWELNDLLAPWLPEGAQANLPMPQVYEVVMGSASPDQLRRALLSVSPRAELTTHEAPMAALIELGSSIQAVGALVMLLVLAAATGTVIFTTRAALVIHQRIIDLVHQMGATDTRLARPFRERAMHMGAVGGLIGTAGALLTLVAIVAVVETDIVGLSRAAMSGWQWLGVAAIPPVFGLIPMVTAHITVMRVLARLP